LNIFYNNFPLKAQWREAGSRGSSSITIFPLGVVDYILSQMIHHTLIGALCHESDRLVNEFFRREKAARNGNGNDCPQVTYQAPGDSLGTQKKAFPKAGKAD
jgi:hypothetical protein